MKKRQIPSEMMRLWQLLGSTTELYIREEDEKWWRAYEIVSRKQGLIEGVYLGDIVGISFRDGELLKPSEFGFEGDSLLQVQGFMYDTKYCVYGFAQQYCLEGREVLVGRENIEIYFDTIAGKSQRVVLID